MTKLRYDYELGYCGELLRDNGTTLCAFDTEPTEEDARRLVACWNACTEIDTDTLEELGPNASLAKIAAKAIAQRDELLEALREANRLNLLGFDCDEVLSAAIQKATKEQV